MIQTRAVEEERAPLDEKDLDLVSWIEILSLVQLKVIIAL